MSRHGKYYAEFYDELKRTPPYLRPQRVNQHTADVLRGKGTEKVKLSKIAAGIKALEAMGK